MLNSNFVIVGVIIGGLGNLSYLIKTLKGEVKPNKVTYILWALAPLIAFSAQVKQGVGIYSLITFGSGFFPLVIFLASFLNRKAYWKIGYFDLFCGGLSVLGLILWLITRTGNVAIFFGILADGLATLPTILKSYKYPETESSIPYFTAVINSILTLLTIKFFNFENSAFPIYFVIANLIIFILIWFKIGKKIQKASL